MTHIGVEVVMDEVCWGWTVRRPWEQEIYVCAKRKGKDQLER